MQSKHSDETTAPARREEVREVDAPRGEELGRSRATSDRAAERDRRSERSGTPESRLDEVIEHGEPGGGPKVENV